jgi:hypothetical protein
MSMTDKLRLRNQANLTPDKDPDFQNQMKTNYMDIGQIDVNPFKSRQSPATEGFTPAEVMPKVYKPGPVSNRVSSWLRSRRPDVIEKQKALDASPERQQYLKDYQKTPQRQEYQRDYQREYQKDNPRNPEVKKAYMQEYQKRPEAKEYQAEYMKEYQKRPEVKAKQKEYYQRKKQQTARPTPAPTLMPVSELKQPTGKVLSLSDKLKTRSPETPVSDVGNFDNSANLRMQQNKNDVIQASPIISQLNKLKTDLRMGYIKEPEARSRISALRAKYDREAPPVDLDDFIDGIQTTINNTWRKK